MFAKGFTKKQNAEQSDSSPELNEYGNNIYTFHNNENDNSSSVQFDTSSKTQKAIDDHSKKDTRLKKRMIAAILYLALSINVLIVFLLIPNRFTSELSSAIPIALSNIWANKSKDSVADIATQPLELQLKNMTLHIMQFGDWNAQKLKHIDLSWQSLSHAQQTKTKQEVWFQLFENALINELNMLENNASNTTKTPTTVLTLITLANSLNIRDIPEYQLVKSNIQSTRVSKPNKAIPISAIKTNTSNPVKTGIKPKSTPKLKSTSHKTTKAPIQKQKVKLQQKNPQKKSLAHIQPDGPTLSELNDITAKFVESYEEGNLEKMMSLFSTKAISNRFDNLEEIKGEYASLFRSTSERQIFIHDLKWTYNKGRAVGKGRMETLLMTDADSKVLARDSRVQLVVEKLGKSTRITRFYELVN